MLGQLTDDSEWPYKGKPYWVLSSRDLRVPEGEGIDVRVADAKVADRYDEMIDSAGEGNLVRRRLDFKLT